MERILEKGKEKEKEEGFLGMNESSFLEYINLCGRKAVKRFTLILYHILRGKQGKDERKNQ